MNRRQPRVTPDRAELLTYVAARPGMWGDDLCGALGWDAGRFWRAAACPLFDCCDINHPAGYRLTEAGRAALTTQVMDGRPRVRKKRKPRAKKIAYAVEGLMFLGVA